MLCKDLGVEPEDVRMSTNKLATSVIIIAKKLKKCILGCMRV